MKKDHNPIKTVFIIKPEIKAALTIISFLKRTVKSETRVEQDYIQQNQKYCIQIHLQTDIYIYIYMYIYIMK